MNKNPLIAMAERLERLSRAYIPPAVSSDARILRAAAEVIETMRSLRDDIREKKICWPAEVDFAVDALDGYEAACKEALE